MKHSIYIADWKKESIGISCQEGQFLTFKIFERTIFYESNLSKTKVERFNKKIHKSVKITGSETVIRRTEVFRSVRLTNNNLSFLLLLHVIIIALQLLTHLNL